MWGDDLKRLIKKAEEKELINLYHGTSDVFYKEIKEKGLMGIGSHGNNVTNQVNAHGMSALSTYGVYLSDSESIAEQYAHRAVDVYGGEPMIVEVRVDVNNLDIDDDFYNMDFEQQEDGSYYSDFQDLSFTEEEYDNPKYEQSLLMLNSCMHRGDIPPSQIVYINTKRNVNNFEDSEDNLKQKASDILYDNGWRDSKNIGFWQKENNPLWITFEDECLEIYSPNSAETPIAMFDYEKIQDAVLFIEENTDKYV